MRRCTIQTFLPYPDFAKSAQCLDNKRLNKQITETWQIAQVLIGESSAWSHHPAVKMWIGREDSLIRYGLECYSEWRIRFLRKQRGGKLIHAAGEKLHQKMLIKMMDSDDPPWLGNPEFHSRHRAILLGKDYDWYSQFGWSEEPAVQDEKMKWPYIWPEVNDGR